MPPNLRRLRYNVAMSLDGFIAGPDGEYDWIAFEPAYDFAALYRQFDTLLMGRRTYEVMQQRGLAPAAMGMKAVVVSTKLAPDAHPGVSIIDCGVHEAVAALKAQPGKDIWLGGGAMLFRSLLDAGLVDTVEVAVIPVLLGSGVSLLPAGERRRLHLEECKALPGGTLILRYAIQPNSRT